jgi:hypothetical protein
MILSFCAAGPESPTLKPLCHQKLVTSSEERVQRGKMWWAEFFLYVLTVSDSRDVPQAIVQEQKKCEMWPGAQWALSTSGPAWCTTGHSHMGTRGVLGRTWWSGHCHCAHFSREASQHREVKLLVQGDLDKKWQSQDSKQRSVSPSVMLLSAMSTCSHRGTCIVHPLDSSAQLFGLSWLWPWLSVVFNPTQQISSVYSGPMPSPWTAAWPGNKDLPVLQGSISKA